MKVQYGQIWAKGNNLYRITKAKGNDLYRNTKIKSTDNDLVAMVNIETSEIDEILVDSEWVSAHYVFISDLAGIFNKNNTK